MTKKSLMIASAIILPLTVGVMAMGIGAGNNHNVANNLFATDTIASTITFANPSSSPEKVANKVYSTRSVTSTNAPIYLINNADDTNNPGVGYVGIFKEQVKTDKLSFYWDYSNSEQVKFQKITNISMTIEANSNRYFVIETSDDGVSFSKLTDFTISGGSGSVDVNILDKYIRIMYDSSRTLLYDTKVQSMTLSYKCSPSGHIDDDKTLSSIAVSDPKTDYVQGDTFVKPVVTATYSDTTQSVVTNEAVFSGYDLDVIGEQTVNVSYTEDDVTKNTSYLINVSEKETDPVAENLVNHGTFNMTCSNEQYNATIVFTNETTGSFTVNFTSPFTPYTQTQSFTWSISDETSSTKIVSFLSADSVANTTRPHLETTVPLVVTFDVNNEIVALSVTAVSSSGSTFNKTFTYSA